MKKLLAIMLTLAMLLCGIAAAAESDDALLPEIEAYMGTWVSGRARLTIEAQDGAIRCTIHWGGSAFESAEWEYGNCMYDEVTGGLTTLEDGVLSEVTYGEGGEIISSEVVYDDGAANFLINDAGELVWTNFKETPGENEMAFERLSEDGGDAATISVDALSEGFVQVIAGIEQGTAGSSLKLAGAACEILAFAAEFDLSDEDANDLTIYVTLALNDLDEASWRTFAENFEAVASLLDACFEDWEANRGAFEDAGAADDMEALLADDAARANWEKLRDGTRMLTDVLLIEV